MFHFVTLELLASHINFVSKCIRYIAIDSEKGLRDVSRKNQFLPGTIRPGRFAQKIERDGSRKKTGTIRSKSNLEVDSPIFVL